MAQPSPSIPTPTAGAVPVPAPPAPPAPPVPPAPVVHKQAKALPKIIITGVFMSIIAGYINATFILSVFKNPVSHLSGTTTKMAAFLVMEGKSDGIFAKFLEQFLILFFFLMGATLTGCMIRAQTFKLGRYFGVVMMIEATLLYMSAIMMAGESLRSGEYAAAMACGLQNAMASRFSGAVIRTTHVTGTATDIGLVVGNYLRWGERINLWKLWIWIPCFLAFFVGAALGTWGWMSLGTNSLFVPASFTLAGGLFFFLHDVMWGRNGWCIEFVPTFLLRQESSELPSTPQNGSSATSPKPDDNSVALKILPDNSAAKESSAILADVKGELKKEAKADAKKDGKDKNDVKIDLKKEKL